MKYPRAFIFYDAPNHLSEKRIKKLLGSKQNVYFQGQSLKDSSIEREIRVFTKYDQLKKGRFCSRTCIVTDATLISDFFRMEVGELNLSIYWLDDKKLYKTIRPTVMALNNLWSAAHQLTNVTDLHHFSLNMVCNLIPSFDWKKYPEYDLEYLCNEASKDLLPLRRTILAHLRTVTRDGIINRFDLP